jgi:hypothetical protein
MQAGRPIPFNDKDLFPLIDSAAHDYRDGQMHSMQVDEFLGFHIEEIEHEMAKKNPGQFEAQEKWIGLTPAALQTPYTEFRTMLNLLELKPGQKVIDLGAGYGRMGMVIGAHYPEVEFIGYEVARERVNEGNRIFNQYSYSNVKLLYQNLTDPAFELPLADIYFIYDFGTIHSIQKVIGDLKDHAKTHAITLVGRGRAVRDQVERHELWLSSVVPPKHFGNFSFYRSRE